MGGKCQNVYENLCRTSMAEFAVEDIVSEISVPVHLMKADPNLE